jgi:hypothetical protein
MENCVQESISSPADPVSTEVPPQRSSVPNISKDLLFKLPLELRDMMYSLCFDRGVYTIRQHGMHFDVRLDDRLQYLIVDHELPQWLPTCKQLLGEAMSQFQRDATYTYASMRIGVPILDTGLLQLHRLKDVRVQYALHVDGCPSLIPRSNKGKYPTHFQSRIADEKIS